MPDLSGRELLRGLPRQLVEPMQRQIQLVEELLERERRLQGEIVGRVTAPIDAVFDLLEESAAMLGKQADALEAAGTALGETARLMKRQADLFERTVSTLRTPTKAAKAIAGVPAEKKKPARKPAARRRKSG